MSIHHRCLHARVVCLIIAATLLLALLPHPGLAAALDPGTLPSLGTLNLATGSYTIDTSSLTFTGPGPTSFSGVESGGIAVFTFTSVTIAEGAVVTARGSRPLALLSQGDVTIAGVLDASGASSGQNFSGGSGALGGPGGGSGGAASTMNGQAAAGSGPGGGTGANNSSGAGGGGFGGSGARGASVGGSTGGAGGAAYGDLRAKLEGGSGGGGAWTTQGAGGGGAIEIGAHGTMVVTSSGAIRANGGSAAVGGRGAPGGGSGGGVLLHAELLTIAGAVTAQGGQGGRGSCCGQGGGGSGGRIAIVARTTRNTGTVSVAGGTSGTGVNGNCAGGACQPGTLSPDLTGATGQIVGGQSITLAAGDGQSTTVGSVFSTELQVAVHDLDNQPLAGVRVTFSAPGDGPGGTFAGSATVTTDAAGIATAPQLAANGSLGTFAVTASAPDLGIAADFTLTNTIGLPAKSAILSGNEQRAMIATPFAAPLSVVVRDAFDHPLPGVEVTFSAPASGASATLSSRTVTTDATGHAAVTAIANGVPGSYTVTARVNDAVAVSFSLSNTVGTYLPMMQSGPLDGPGDPPAR